MFTLEFETDNAAFDDDQAEQVAATLEVLAQQIRAGHVAGQIRDPNGNTIGEYVFAWSADRG